MMELTARLFRLPAKLEKVTCGPSRPRQWGPDVSDSHFLYMMKESQNTLYAW